VQFTVRKTRVKDQCSRQKVNNHREYMLSTYRLLVLYYMIIRMAVKDELERIWKKLIVAY